jgi:hypothetical protein
LRRYTNVAFSREEEEDAKRINTENAQYTDEKTLRQNKIANALVLLVIEALQEGAIPQSVYSHNPDARYGQLFHVDFDSDAEAPVEVCLQELFFYSLSSM